MKDSLSAIISLWANLLAISAGITLTGLIEINVKPTLHVLQPTYVVEKDVFRNKLIESNYPLTDSIINTVFGAKSILVVDVPDPNANILNTGEVIAGIHKSPEGKIFRYKELTDGKKNFRSAEFAYDSKAELKNDIGLQDVYDSNLSTQKELLPYHKRFQLMPYFSSMISNYSWSNCLLSTTDSLLRIDSAFASNRTYPPPFLDKVLFESRKVISMVSVENNQGYDLKNLEIRLFKKYSIAKSDEIKLEAWTIGESTLKYNHKEGSEILIEILNLRANSEIQLLISSWIHQIRKEDIFLSYDSLKSLNKSCLWIILASTLFLSIVIQCVKFR